MPWNANLTNLKYVLADLYYLQSLSIPVIREAGMSPAQITLNERATVNWSNILDEALKRNRVPNLIEAALKDYPDDQRLISARDGTLTPVRDLVGNPLDWKTPSTETENNFERITGKQSTLLPVHWLEVGVTRARPVARVKRTDGTYGSGFLIKG
ncbi:MAG: hypothetical protein WCS37_22790, partial [Chloroflexota bacterium]